MPCCKGAPEGPPYYGHAGDCPACPVKVYPAETGTMAQACDAPPEGWYCTGTRGHDGPCAALPRAVPENRMVEIRLPWVEAEAATKSLWAFRHLGAKLYRLLKAHVAQGWTLPEEEST